MISGYSLTGEKCTPCEPSQPARKVCTGLQVARWCESTSASPFGLHPPVRFLESGSTRPRHSAALQSTSVSPPLCTHGIDFIIKKKKSGKNNREIAHKDMRDLI